MIIISSNFILSSLYTQLIWKIILLIFMLTLHIEAKLTENELENYLQNVYEKQASNLCFKSNSATFDFEIDIKNASKEKLARKITLETAAWDRSVWQKYFKNLRTDDFIDSSVKRQVKLLRILGNAALDDNKLSQLTNVGLKLTGIYSTAKICPYGNKHCNLDIEGLHLEPDIEEIMSKSRNYDELMYIWKQWRDASGAKMKNLYKIYVDLSNEAANANNFTDKGDLWRYAYEDPNFIQDIDSLWREVEPLYNELHKYVASKLIQRYGDKIDNSDGLLPAHIFGNLWAQTWENIGDIVKPFPEIAKVDVDAAFRKQKYTVLDMFKKAEEFYRSLGLLPMEMSYNETAGAMINKPAGGREVLCHASAWDFCDEHTYRLKMCTKIKFEDFKTIHHEMGHIQYYLLYKNQPYTFRDGANPAFHEAVGDTMTLSMSTPKHLSKIDLTNDFTDSYKNNINTLMDMALDKVAFLPFGLLIDKWRWDVFNRSVPIEKWNTHWWDYRIKYQKIKPPLERSDARDFDPGAKFHIPGDAQYIAYFLAHILQFQFYRTLCTEAKEYNPNNKSVLLHQCDFYNSKAAGQKLREGLSLGSSKHWSEILEMMTGSKSISAKPLLEYFMPLYDFLKMENTKENVHMFQVPKRR